MTDGGECTGGSADSGCTAAPGAPTVCGTGRIGEQTHSAARGLPHRLLIPPANALALAILRLNPRPGAPATARAR